MKINLPIAKPLLLVMVVSLLLNGCRKDEEFAEQPFGTSEDGTPSKYPIQKFDSRIAQDWYSLLLRLIKESPGHTPPIAARELGYTGIALYQSAIAGMQGHRTLAGQLQGLNSLPMHQRGKAYIPPVAANAALGRIVEYMQANASAANLNTIDSLEAANEQYFLSIYDADDVNRSVSYGHAVADAIYNWSLSDGGHQAYLTNFPPYTPPVGAGMWVSTPPLFQTAMLPSWGNNRTFVAANASQLLDPPPPPSFSTTPGSSLHNAAMEVYTTGQNLTQAQKDIANFWADGGGTFTPSGHNIAIAMQLIRNEKMNLKEAAILLAKIGIAQNDAGILCWKAKFTHNVLRPVSYINNYIDNSWTSFIGTPPFPSYTSGHSTFSGSAGKLLSITFGNNYSFNDSSKVQYGMPVRSFASPLQAAQEAAVSRLYGGIHYSFDNAEGFNCGVNIALNVEGLKW